jgi:hypothetical protein
MSIDGATLVHLGQALPAGGPGQASLSPATPSPDSLHHLETIMLDLSIDGFDLEAREGNRVRERSGGAAVRGEDVQYGGTAHLIS